MATNTSISLDLHFSDFLARQVATGRYRTASEVIRTGLRLLDLPSIWDVTQKRCDAGQAESYITEIRFAIERIAADANRGRACDDIRDGYRRYAIGRHLIFFVDRGDRVDVMRILHQRMDPTRPL